MANTIQIKRGASKPQDNTLAPYELGISTNDMQLYIGDKDQKTSGIKVAQADQAITATQLSETLSVGKGGTGATTVAQARQNLIYTDASEMDGDTPQDHRSFGSGINYMGDNSFIINATTGYNMIGQIKLKCAEGKDNKSQLSFRTGTATSSNQWFTNNEWLNVITNKDIIPIANGGTGATTVDGARANLGLRKTDLVDLIYPIGSIYISVNQADPSTLFGGTWERIEDRFLLAASDTYKAGATGGEATHELTIDEMPSHNHGFTDFWSVSQSSYTAKVVAMVGDKKGSNNLTDKTVTANTGGGNAHNNMPPYLAVYIWKRTG